jgi:hypothetical protein
MRAIGFLVLLLLAGLMPAPVAAQYGGATLRCRSREFRDNHCPANTRGGVWVDRGGGAGFVVY